MQKGGQSTAFSFLVQTVDVFKQLIKSTVGIIVKIYTALIDEALGKDEYGDTEWES